MWSTYETKYHGYQVVPDRDIAAHYADRLCLCVPTRRWVAGAFDRSGAWVVTHNAWDGREYDERAAANTVFADEGADTLSVWVEGGMV